MIWWTLFTIAIVFMTLYLAGAFKVKGPENKDDSTS